MTDSPRANELQRERSEIVAQVTPGTYRTYERVRKGRRGVAVAEVIDGRCKACNIMLRLQYYQDLRKGDQILLCESCQRILFYNPPVAVEDLTA